MEAVESLNNTDIEFYLVIQDINEVYLTPEDVNQYVSVRSSQTFENV